MNKINLNKITEEQVQNMFDTERLLRMYYTVLDYSFKDIPNYELVRILGTSKMNFNVSVDNSRSGVCSVYVTDKITDKKYEFRY